MALDIPLCRKNKEKEHFCYFFLKNNFITFLCVHTSRETNMEIKTVLDLLYVVPAILDQEIFL